MRQRHDDVCSNTTWEVIPSPGERLRVIRTSPRRTSRGGRCPDRDEAGGRSGTHQDTVRHQVRAARVSRDRPTSQVLDLDFVGVSFVTDVFSRRVSGWRVSPSSRSDLVLPWTPAGWWCGSAARMWLVSSITAQATECGLARYLLMARPPHPPGWTACATGGSQARSAIPPPPRPRSAVGTRRGRWITLLTSIGNAGKP